MHTYIYPYMHIYIYIYIYVASMYELPMAKIMDLIPLFNDISTFMGYLMPKPPF